MSKKNINVKKVLVVSHSGEMGGAEMALLEDVDYLVANIPSIQPHFVIPAEGELSAAVAERRWTYSVIDYSGWLWPKKLTGSEDIFREHIKNMRATRFMSNLIHDIKPQAVITSTLVVPWGAIAAARERIAHIWLVREYGDLDHGQTFDLGRKDTLEDIDLLSDLVVANSLNVANHLSKYISNDKIITAYTPLSLQKIQKQSIVEVESCYSDSAELKIVIVGRISPSKGQKDIVSALALLKDEGLKIELNIVGRPQEEKDLIELKSHIDKLKLSDLVYFSGYTTNPLAHIKHADIGVTASKNEAFGRTTFEYLALSKPVIATNIGGSKELISDGSNGFLVEPGDVDQLADKLRVYATNRVTLIKHSNNAHTSVENILTGDHSLKGQLHRFAEIINNGGNSHKRIPSVLDFMINFADVAEDYKNIVEQNIIERVRVLESELHRSKSIKYHLRKIIKSQTPVVLLRRIVKRKD
jgi:glycosyltransferase involved in cell wall biosynthesis